MSFGKKDSWNKMPPNSDVTSTDSREDLVEKKVSAVHSKMALEAF